MKDFVIELIKQFYWKTEGTTKIFNTELYNEHAPFWCIGMLVGATIVFFSLLWLTQQILLQSIYIVSKRTKNTWDDSFIRNGVFKAVAYLVPLFCLDFLLQIVFYNYATWLVIFQKITDVMIIVVILVSINRSLNAIRDIVKAIEVYRDKPIQSYFQISKIVITGIFIILILARLTNQSPLFFLTSLGAMTAILLLVFKDTILGFVGSIQLAANDMVRIGDWVTMEKYGADGTVTELNIATVKVQNFDKTITTIPTYAFISDSFINWRGMQESDGRRIKRSLFIQIDTIHFASDELLNRLKKIRILEKYIAETQHSVEQYNLENGFAKDDHINARHQTNIGLFRKYVENYLLNHPEVNQDMPLIARQLAPTPNGVPLEIYCFTRAKEWSQYEWTMADIFDHLFAIVELFELELFESPSGRDVRAVVNGLK